jgi:hypothetical protein
MDSRLAGAWALLAGGRKHYTGATNGIRRRQTLNMSKQEIEGDKYGGEEKH